MIDYYSNPEKRTVVAKLVANDRSDDGLVCEAADFMVGRMAKILESSDPKGSEIGFDAAGAVKVLALDIASQRMKSSYIGKAKCMDVDAWDEETGKKFAQQRCLEKYYLDLHLASSELADLLKAMSDAAYQRAGLAAEACNKWCNKENALMQEVCGE